LQLRWFIGDVHGCPEEFEEIIVKIYKQDPDAHIYSVGDVINKGPDTTGALDVVEKYQVNCICGNHELWFLAIMNRSRSKWLPQDWKFYEQFKGCTEKYLPLIQSWKTHIDFDDITLVHGGVVPGTRDLNQMDPWLSARIRYWDGTGEDLNNPANPPWDEVVKWDKTIVFGHWAARGLVNKNRFKGIDTGVVYGNELTAWCAEKDEFLQVKAKKQYLSIKT
jgi:bis(5'-nucleosyl)-tetraphosphatase (symmetrical)